MNWSFARKLAVPATLVSLAACSSSSPMMTGTPPGDGNATDPLWCGRGVDVDMVTPPTGFCLKNYAQITEARGLVAAPNGDLFVAAPSTSAPGGASNGPGAIILLSDDDKDGVAEAHSFLSHIDAGTTLSEVHGLALGGGYLYFTMKASVYRVPYADGDRAAMAMPEDLKLPAVYATGGRWTHGLARSVGGQLYTSRGVYASCSETSPGGDISSIDATTGALTPVATGFRNPMYLRCHRTDEVCAAMELGEDLQPGAREKMLLLKPSTNYGYPCCYSMAAPTPDAAAMNPPLTCDDIAKEDASFPLSDTPFGFDWETGVWPAPYQNGVFVALHGSAYSSPSWQGAAVVWAPTDPTTHAPVQDWQTFQGGWGPGEQILKRPSDVAFGADGRMFIADDTSGHVYWIAPATMPAPAAPTTM